MIDRPEEVPKKLFHVTRLEDLPEVLENGLDPERSASRSKAVYLAVAWDVAENYLGFDASKAFAMIEIDGSALDETALQPDDYELPDLWEELPEERFEELGLDPENDWDRECDWRDSVAICGQVAYEGRVPPEAMRVVAYLRGWDQSMDAFREEAEGCRPDAPMAPTT